VRFVIAARVQGAPAGAARPGEGDVAGVDREQDPHDPGLVELADRRPLVVVAEDLPVALPAFA
jgi:hypothetical protein